MAGLANPNCGTDGANESLLWAASVRKSYSEYLRRTIVSGVA